MLLHVLSLVNCWQFSTLSYLLALILIGLNICWNRSRSVRLINAIPGPKTLPLIGNALQVNVDQAELTRLGQDVWVKEFGPVFRVWAGFRPVVVVGAAETVEPILSNSRLITKSIEYYLIKPWLGNSLIAASDAHWKGRRRLLTPAFHFQILHSFFDIFNEEAKKLVDIINDKIGHNEQAILDVNPILTKCALDILCGTSMGQVHRPEEEKINYIKNIHRIGQIAMERGVRPWLLYDFIFYATPLGWENKRCVKALHDYTEQVVKDRKMIFKKNKMNNNVNAEEDKSKVRLAFLDLMLQAAENGADLTDEDIREEVDGIMFAGHDTTAFAMTWFLYCISKHPEEQQLIANELDSVFGDPDRPCTKEDICELKYLECCIKESLRLYPSVPVIFRQLTEDVNIGGYTVPSGTSIAVLTYGTHRNPKVFDDPDMFKPSRFLPENSHGRHPYAFVPFSAGPRNCIGQKYALLELKLVLATLLRKFQFRNKDMSKNLQPGSSEVVLKPTIPVELLITRRH